MAADWPLLERHAEVDLLVTALHGRTASTMISGPTGSGRTRLLDEVCRHAERRGWRVLRAVTAPWLTDMPLLALTALLPDLAAPVEGSDHGALFRRVRLAAVDTSDGQPILLAVDDAHLLDETSAALVHYLMATGAARVLATVCAGHPLAPAVSALCSTPDTRRVDLEPLGRDSVTRLLTGTLGADVDPALVERLWQLSQGSPLMLRELLIAGQETDALHQVDGRWRLGAQLTTSRRLRDVVNLRMGQLPAGVREVVEALAVGEPLSVALLEALTSADSLSAAERAGLVVERVDGRRATATLTHPVYADVLRSALPPARLRAIRRALADHLARTGARRHDDVLRLAVWRSEAGDRLDPETLMAAADKAASVSDHATAGRLAIAAVAVGGGLRARLVAAAALHNLGRLDEAEQMLADLSADDDGPARAQLALRRATILLHGYGHARAAASSLAATRNEIRSPSWRAELDALHAQARLLDGEPIGALDEATGVLASPEAGERAILAALVTAVPALAVQGRGHDAIAAAEHARELVSHLDDQPPPQTLELIELTAAIAYVTTGRLLEYESVADERYRRALSAGNDATRGVWALAAGSMALYRGVVGTATRRLAEAADLLRAHPTLLGPYGLAWCLADLATAHALAGAVDRADAALAAVDALLPADTPLPQRLLARPWLAVARGALDEARALALAAAREVGAAGFRVFELQALLDAARISPGDDVTALLRALTDHVDGPLAATCLEFSRASTDRDGNLLGESARRFESLGMLLVAAEAWTRAAQAHQRAGRSGPAAAAAGRAKRLTQTCDGARSPWFAGLDRQTTLTARETQILHLVRQGLTNRQIAERLVLSPRTVESHRNNAYRKLGVRTVGELEAVLDT